MSQPLDSQAPEQRLPLFRPEALASQQEKYFGEILRLRPLSSAFLLWLGLALAGVVLVVLLLAGGTGKSLWNGHSHATANPGNRNK